MTEAALEVERVDVAIIGGGITGLSLAWQLRRHGVDRVAVFEAGEPGFKSTGQSSGGIRRQFATRLEIELTLASLAFYDRLFADPAFGGAFHPVGYAFLAGPSQVAGLERAWALQRDLGIAAEWLGRHEIEERFPYVDPEGLVGGTFCGDDGFVDPSAIVAWLVRACRAAGVTIAERSPVEAVEVGGGRVRGVRVGGRTIAAEAVVNAAGAWAGEVAALFGVPVPVSPSPRVKYLTGPHPALPAAMPLIVDLPTGAYVRSDRGRAMVGVKPRSEAVGFVADAAAAELDWMRWQAAVRFPSLGHERPRELIQGLYETTPDGLPVAGAVGGVAGGYVVAGFNGHGIMHAPAVAEAVAELIVGGRSERIDLGPLRPDRFLAGGAASGTAVLL